MTFSVKQLLKEAMEEVHQSSCNIYGVVSSSDQAMDSFTEAINTQIGKLVSQEESFTEMQQNRQVTPVVEKVRDIVKKEESRVKVIQAEALLA